jgi:hypothetical protein
LILDFITKYKPKVCSLILTNKKRHEIYGIELGQPIWFSIVQSIIIVMTRTIAIILTRIKIVRTKACFFHFGVSKVILILQVIQKHSWWVLNMVIYKSFSQYLITCGHIIKQLFKKWLITWWLFLKMYSFKYPPKNVTMHNTMLLL